MAWLNTLLTPPGGVVLDLFAGTGTTGAAAAAGDDYQTVLIERDPVHVAMITKRLSPTDDVPVEDDQPSLFDS